MKFEITQEMLDNRHHSIEFLAKKYGISQAIEIKHYKPTRKAYIKKDKDNREQKKVERYGQAEVDIRQEFYSLYDLTNGKLTMKKL